MRVLFADTCFLKALCDKEDSLHEKAKAIYDGLDGALLVTTDLVLVELLNFMAKYGSHARQFTLDFIDRLRSSGEADVIPFSSPNFHAALELYRKHSDKNWGLTDCDSICICRGRRINEVLTEDKGFDQAGLRAIMRDSR